MSEYTGTVGRLLKKAGVRVGDRIRVEKKGRVHEGILMPRTELGDPLHIVLKLPNGYNIGIRATSKTKIILLERGAPPRLAIPKLDITPDPRKPTVAIIGTGGTIASRVDYRTGAVFPAFTPEEIYSAVPEVAEIANIRVIEVCNVFSEHMKPELWMKIARAVAREINAGARGVVIAHGTDTMGYTAAALSFLLEGLFRPVVLVGSQRSSDRPSSDAALNLISAVKVAAESDIAEVTVVMHGAPDDDFCLIHRGPKVRKCHTSRRDAFQTINDAPLGAVGKDGIRLFRTDYNKAKDGGKVRIKGKFEPRILLLKVTPGLSPDILKWAVARRFRGIVLEGTGLGHAPESLFEGIKLAVRRKIPVVMTSQCLWGRIDMKVYSTGRDLLQLGVIPGEDMLPEVAWVKLMWVLGQTRKMERIKELMRTNIAGEITPVTGAETFIKPAYL
ncbi:MAG: Glu-tRNA(Gln) amidotransferase subunit GatD [Candidatus Hadarchaeales archaeon]